MERKVEDEERKEPSDDRLSSSSLPIEIPNNNPYATWKRCRPVKRSTPSTEELFGRTALTSSTGSAEGYPNSPSTGSPDKITVPIIRDGSVGVGLQVAGHVNTATSTLSERGLLLRTSPRPGFKDRVMVNSLVLASSTPPSNSLISSASSISLSTTSPPHYSSSPTAASLLTLRTTAQPLQSNLSQSDSGVFLRKGMESGGTSSILAVTNSIRSSQVTLTTTRPGGQPIVINDIAHDFKLHTFNAITWCHFCWKYLSGAGNQGYRCKHCYYAAHSKCAPKVNTRCGIHMPALSPTVFRSMPIAPVTAPSNSRSTKKGSRRMPPTNSNGPKHQFNLVSFQKPVWCDVCSKFIW